MKNVEELLKLHGVRENEPLNRHTTFGVGGVARYFVEVRTPDALVEAVSLAQDLGVRFYIIAGGSNMVISDAIFPGLTIKVCGDDLEKNGNEITADAGVPLMKLIEEAMDSGLSGLETLSGIPGTVGGAIVGNAAAYGQAIGDTVASVLVFDMKSRERQVLSRHECEFSYRDSMFKGGGSDFLVLRATFSFVPKDKTEIEAKSKEIVATRSKKYPPGLKTPGSFFKNLWADKLPLEVLTNIQNLKDFYGKVPAWYFLNEVGARGMKHGGLRIADFHGNYIINDGNATYGDVRELAEELKKRVREKFKVELEEEVRYLEP